MTDSALAAALLLALRLLIPGLAWSWPLYPAMSKSGSQPAAMAVTGSATLLTGLVVNLLLVLILGEAGLYLPAIEWGLLGALTATGAALGFARHRGALRRHAALSLPVAALFALGVFVVLLLPARGEWILGGWDPGVYINEGIALEKTGTLHPDDSFFADNFSGEEKKAFTRTGHGRTERFPGIVVDDERRAFTFEFFRLTPAMIALLHRSGGLTAAVRVNTVLGLLTLLFIAALLWTGTGGTHALFTTALLASQPIWLYHTHTPVSEMLHLTLILGIGLIATLRLRGPLASILKALLMLLLILNRYSFLPFSGILLAFLALSDLEREDRRQVLIERLLQIGAVLAGAMIDLSIAPVSPRGWSPSIPIFDIFFLGAFTSLVIDCLSSWRVFRSLPGRIPTWARWTGITSLILAMAWLLTLGTKHIPVRHDDDILFRVASFTGYLPLLAGAAGAIFLFSRRGNALTPIKSVALFLAAIASLLLMKPWIVAVYPWATRRNLPYLVPAVAVFAGYLPALLWDGLPRKRLAGKIAAIVLLAALLLPLARKSWHAWSRVEFQGVSSVLARAADEIGGNDVVIVDSPRWGTPLALVHGKEVLNGKHLWRRKSAEEREIGLAALARLHREGRSIRFLTSTKGPGLDIYPFPIEPVTLDWESGDFALEEIIHSRRATDFVVSEKTHHLRLYTWSPPPPEQSFAPPSSPEYHSPPPQGATGRKSGAESQR